MTWEFKREKNKVARNEKRKEQYWVFVCIKYGKFWSILLGHFIKHKPLISEECTWYWISKVKNLLLNDDDDDTTIFFNIWLFSKPTSEIMIYLSRNSERCKIFHGILKNPYYVDSAKVTAILCMYNVLPAMQKLH